MRSAAVFSRPDSREVVATEERPRKEPHRADLLVKVDSECEVSLPSQIRTVRWYRSAPLVNRGIALLA